MAENTIPVVGIAVATDAQGEQLPVEELKMRGENFSSSLAKDAKGDYCWVNPSDRLLGALNGEA